MKIISFTFIIIFKVLRKEQVAQSNLCENKCHFNYMRFIKLLSLEYKQNELLFKFKLRLIYESIYSLFTLKKRGRGKTQMREWAGSEEKNKERRRRKGKTEVTRTQILFRLEIEFI